MTDEGKYVRFLLCALMSFFIITTAQETIGATIYWTDWTSATVGTPGSASGSITFPGPFNIGVTYSGEVASTTQTSGGTNYWNSAPSVYTDPGTVDNGPTNSDIITLDRSSSLNTITFSSPVVDPVMAFLSLGRDPAVWGPNYIVRYEFDAPFTVLNYGPNNIWAGVGTLTDIGSNTLEGIEGNGIIQFSGTFSSISWSNSPNEYWHGFTVGAPVPEPGTMLLLGSELIGLAGWGRKKFKK